MCIEILFKVLLFEGGVPIYAKHCITELMICTFNTVLTSKNRHSKHEEVSNDTENIKKAYISLTSSSKVQLLTNKQVLTIRGWVSIGATNNKQKDVAPLIEQPQQKTGILMSQIMTYQVKKKKRIHDTKVDMLYNK